MKAIFTTILATLLMCVSVGYADAKPLNLNEVLEGTVRVGTADNYGTGTVVAEKDGKYFILTNAHVIGNAKTATVEFFTQGAKTLPIVAKLHWIAHYKRTDIDFALITIPVESLSTWKPRVIPLASRGYGVSGNTYIQSAGSPEGRWPMAWEGRVIHDAGSRLRFTPPPTNGQSGGGLLVNIADATGELHTRVAGVITWRDGTVGQDYNGYDIATGAAIPVDRLYDAMEGKVSSPKTVPSTYSLIGTAKIEDSSLLEKALGADGKYYKVVVDNGEMEAVNLPLGVRVIRWPSLEVRLPANQLVPSPFINQHGFDGGYGRSNGYFFSAGDYGGYNTPAPDNEEELKELKAELAEQKALVSQMTIELTTLKVDKANLTQELNKLRAEAGSNSPKVQELQKTIQQRDNEIVTLTHNMEVMQANVVEKDNTVKALEVDKTEMERVRGQRNIFGVSTILGVLSTIGVFLWKRLGRKKIGEVLDEVENKLQDKVDDKFNPEVVKSIFDAIDRLEGKLADRIDNKLGTDKDAKPDPELEKLIDAVKDALLKTTIVVPPTPPVVNLPPVVITTGLTVDERKYTASEILDAVQQVSSMDPSLAHVGNMVRLVLKKK